jgi:hypothetical protein
MSCSLWREGGMMIGSVEIHLPVLSSSGTTSCAELEVWCEYHSHFWVVLATSIS